MSPAHSFIHSLNKDVYILSDGDRSGNRTQSLERLVLATPAQLEHQHKSNLVIISKDLLPATAVYVNLL